MSILQKILAAKAHEVAAARAGRSVAELEGMIRDADAPRGFARALRRGPGQDVRVIAEIKRASPSAGPIWPDADPALVARAYESAGAAAISVLTDEHFFSGHIDFLPRVRKAAVLPLLRKEFVIDPYQVIEARAFGADAVLLIVAALEDARLCELVAVARDLDLDALVEVHNPLEAERALAAGAAIIGVNHRDLATFTMDMTLTGAIRKMVPKDIILVGESGIRGRADVCRLGDAGADAVLVGEHLMRGKDPGVALAALLRDEGPFP